MEKDPNHHLIFRLFFPMARMSDKFLSSIIMFWIFNISCCFIFFLDRSQLLYKTNNFPEGEKKPQTNKPQKTKV